MVEVIKANDRLLRRVQFLNPNFIKDDGTPASSSFSPKKGENGISVDLERLTTYSNAIKDERRFRLFVLDAGYTRSLGLENIHEPTIDNYAHSLIKGNITRGVARKLAQKAKRIAFPD